MTVSKEVLQSTAQCAASLGALDPAVQNLLVILVIITIFSLLRSAYRALVTVGTICHRPCKHTGGTEPVLVVTLLHISQYQVTKSYIITDILCNYKEFNKMHL